jgi:hypothetical protein
MANNSTLGFCPAPAFYNPQYVATTRAPVAQAYEMQQNTRVATTQDINNRLVRIQGIVIQNQTAYDRNPTNVTAEHLRSALNRGRERLDELKKKASPHLLKQINGVAAYWRHMGDSLAAMKREGQFHPFGIVNKTTNTTNTTINATANTTAIPQNDTDISAMFWQWIEWTHEQYNSFNLTQTISQVNSTALGLYNGATSRSTTVWNNVMQFLYSSYNYYFPTR